MGLNQLMIHEACARKLLLNFMLFFYKVGEWRHSGRRLLPEGDISGGIVWCGKDGYCCRCVWLACLYQMEEESQNLGRMETGGQTVDSRRYCSRLPQGVSGGRDGPLLTLWLEGEDT